MSNSNAGSKNNNNGKANKRNASGKNSGGASSNLNSNVNALKKMMKRTSKHYNDRSKLERLKAGRNQMYNGGAYHEGKDMNNTIEYLNGINKKSKANPGLYKLHNNSLKAMKELETLENNSLKAMKELETLEKKRRELTVTIKNLKNQYKIMLSQQNNMLNISPK